MYPISHQCLSAPVRTTSRVASTWEFHCRLLITSGGPNLQKNLLNSCIAIRFVLGGCMCASIKVAPIKPWVSYWHRAGEGTDADSKGNQNALEEYRYSSGPGFMFSTANKPENATPTFFGLENGFWIHVRFFRSQLRVWGGKATWNHKLAKHAIPKRPLVWSRYIAVLPWWSDETRLNTESV